MEHFAKRVNRRDAAARTPSLAPTTSREPTPWGVNVAGFFRSELGIGEAARSVITALDAQGVPLMPVHGSYIPGNRQGHSFAVVRPESAPFPVNLICINPEELPIFLNDAGPAFVSDRYTIAFWWWEVSAFPKRWIPVFKLVDEVWVGSDHVQHNLQAASDGVPVTKMRIPVVVPRVVHCSREELGLPPGFLFLFMFDFNSIFERKNPLATIAAFVTAFPPGAGASLVVKCINHEADPDNYARLTAAAADHPDVHVVNRYVSAEEKNGMIAACDCYVSLHRAEGFALTPAEALALGKPVVATRYSGNLEFMTDANSYLVDYSMIPIRVSNRLYPPDGEWADPDVDHAARLLRQVFDDRSDAQRRAARGAAEIRTTFSPESTGEHMARRLLAIREQMRTTTAAPCKQPAGGERSGGDNGEAWRDRRRRLQGLLTEAVHRYRSRAQQSTLDLPLRGAEVAVLLAELRRQDAAASELRAELAALEQRIALGERNARD